MVGDSYKSVIDAADAIGVMKNLGDKLVATLDGLDQKCVLQTSTADQVESGVGIFPSLRVDEKLRIAASIRILVVTPEQVTYTISNDRYGTAWKQKTLQMQLNNT